MTEGHVRKQLRRAVEQAYAAGFADAAAAAVIPVPPARRQVRRAVQMLVLAEAAEALVLPAVAVLVQDALEQGFNGRADAGAA